MIEARNLIQAERCSLFILDKQHNCLIAKIFDGITITPHWDISGMTPKDLSFPTDQGIAGHVAVTGDLLNIKDAYSHPLFHQGMDQNTGFKTRYVVANYHLTKFLLSEYVI